MTTAKTSKSSATGRVVLRESGGSGRTVTWTVRRGTEKRSDYLPPSSKTKTKKK